MKRVVRSGLRVMGILLALTFGAGEPSAPAFADSPNTVRAFIQPLGNCSISFIGNLVCDGGAGTAVPITAGSAPDTTSLRLGGYRLCWTSAAGVTAPTGAACGAGDAPLTAPVSNVNAQYPVTFSGTPYQGCGSIPTPNANDIAFFVRDLGTCTFTITTPDAPGFTGTQTTFTFGVRPAASPLLLGPLAPATERRVRAGGTSPLQSVYCRYQVETLGNVKFGCSGVMLNWTVLTGRRACQLIENTRKNSEELGTISVLFLKPGRCTVVGTYPAVPGSSDAFTTSEYEFTVAGKRARDLSR